ncbi:endoplasmic reticulum aminopeptidase 1 isoform X2 [Bemisia tabaci]|uniref:endoplasmic reticulum aminopeptidase 1 isoform X2 n=1 Tax=Bemisia tabaci TaxID=7038 RepID=UPI0008F9D98D|nr:PREDICTED: endoplasmic reticulum aminopeptidase 1-like isoform X2 [Bemisia tabaci]
MSDHEVDDVTFLTETRYYRENRHGMHKREMYGEDRLAVCSQQRALIITSCTLIMLFVVALIIAYVGPQNDCPCIGQRPLFLDDDDNLNATRSVIPIATTGEIFPWNNLRLPTFARPQRYHINIHPNLTTLDVKGQVSIDFQVERDTNFIVFHSKNLTISEKFVMDKKNHHYKVPILRFLEYTSGQQIYIEFKEKLRRRTNYTLMIRYTTRLSRELDGFYLSSYNTSTGEKRYLATTHFEPTYARSAFPCFDEPQFKARFKMSIFRDRFHISLFNMPIVNTEDAGFYMGTGLLKDDFQESVEMSTYLVAFVVCDYDHITERTKKNVSVSVYAPPDLIPQAKFALNIAKSMMDHYEEFFGFAYPLPKQDLIAIPDFGVGAMENWGLITSRTTSILYDPQETSAAAQQYVAVVIAHEIAHQWFGNLVTMRWWNDLWLNEGFASYLEYSGVDHVMPEWSMMEQLILDKTQQGLYLDALSTSHPISVSVYDPVEIEAIFDSISYSKGAAVLYMLEKFLTLDVLRSGLNDYLNIHKYGNADTKDFWSVLSKHANESIQVKQLMDSWTRQMGFPVVRIYRENTTGEGANIYTAAQSRFLLTAWLHGENSTIRLEPRSPYNYKWYIPLNYYTDQTSYVTTETVWMNMTDVKFEVDPGTQWVKVNVNQSCFYRVNYEDELWHAIIKQLKQNHHMFTPADRASLIDDIFTLSRGGMVDAALPLELSLYLMKERDYVPWATALEHLQTWSKVLAEATPYRLFLDLMKKLLSPVAQAVGWNDSGSHLKKLMRSDVLASAVLVGVEDVVKHAQLMFNNWMNNGEKIPPNLREVVYLAGIKYGGVKEWKFCWNRYNATRIVSEKKLLLKVLGAASDSWLLQRYLLATLSREMIKPQDIKLVVGVVASNPEGRFLAWRHLKSHWNSLQTLLGNATISMGSFIASVTSHFATSFDYDEVYRFFKNVDVGSGARDLDQSLETIRLNTFWVKHNEENIHQWLNNYLSKN